MVGLANAFGVVSLRDVTGIFVWILVSWLSKTHYMFFVISKKGGAVKMGLSQIKEIFCADVNVGAAMI